MRHDGPLGLLVPGAGLERGGNWILLGMPLERIGKVVGAWLERGRKVGGLGSCRATGPEARSPDTRFQLKVEVKNHQPFKGGSLKRIMVRFAFIFDLPWALCLTQQAQYSMRRPLSAHGSIMFLIKLKEKERTPPA